MDKFHDFGSCYADCRALCPGPSWQEDRTLAARSKKKSLVCHLFAQHSINASTSARASSSLPLENMQEAFSVLNQRRTLAFVTLHPLLALLPPCLYCFVVKRNRNPIRTRFLLLIVCQVPLHLILIPCPSSEFLSINFDPVFFTSNSKKTQKDEHRPFRDLSLMTNLHAATHGELVKHVSCNQSLIYLDW